MKIIITGGSGFLGSYLVDKLNTSNKVIGLSGKASDTDLIQCDITQKEQVLNIINKHAPQVIIHCAGISRNYYNNPSYGSLVNITGTQNIADAAKTIRATLIYISSAAVFKGRQGLFAEKDAPGTTDSYGQTKIKAESIIQTYSYRHLIIRPSLIIGHSPKGTEKTYLGQIVKAISKKQKLLLDNSWKFSPSWNWHIEKVIQWWLLNNSQENLLHVSSMDTTTKMEFAKKIFERLCLDQALIQELTYEENTANNILDSKKLKEIGAPIITVDNILDEITKTHVFGNIASPA